MARSAFEYDGELAVNLLLEAKEDLLENLSQLPDDDIWGEPFNAEFLWMRETYLRLLTVWPGRRYGLDETEVLVSRFVTLTPDVECSSQIADSGICIDLHHRSWIIREGQTDSFEPSGYLVMGYTDLIGVGWPCINNEGLSPEAIIVLDHLSGLIWAGDHLARLGDILTAENEKRESSNTVKQRLVMFNESIHAHSLIDVYERLKEHKKNADSAHLPLLHSMQEHYKDFHQIKSQIGQSSLKSSLWWMCIRLEESMWESIRLFQQEYGYDPRWIKRSNGRAGLKGFDGNETVPCLFDEVLITFDGMERMEYPIPVRKDGKCGLVRPDGTGTPVTPFKYDLLFREPYSDFVKYIAVLDGKFGVVNIKGEEIVPCILDDIFERQDTDGFLPVLKDGKWGIYTDSETFIPPKFDQLDICSEDCLKARIGSRWGWVTENGDLTEDQRQAAIGSWYDVAK